MSLILDALRRAERERQAGQPVVPGPVTAPVARRRTLPRPLMLGAVMVGIVALVVVALMAARRAWQLPPGETRSVETAARPATPPAPAPAPAAPVTAPARPVETPAAIAGTESVTSLDELTGEPTIEEPLPSVQPEPPPRAAAARPPKPATVETRPLAQAPPPQARAVPPDPAAAAPEPATAEPESVPEPAPAPAPAPGRAAADAEPSGPAVPPALTQQAPLRRLREMPPEYRAEFPALSIDVHSYERMPERRFVLINGRRYRQGERLAEGPQLVEIARDGVVFEFRSEKVFVPLQR